MVWADAKWGCDSLLMIDDDVVKDAGQMGQMATQNVCANASHTRLIASVASHLLWLIDAQDSRPRNHTSRENLVGHFLYVGHSTRVTRRTQIEGFVSMDNAN